MRRIGIYAGAFNPVHAGHIAFALQAIEAAKLDAVYFLPERRPRHKPEVEHFGHRVAMLKRAVRPHPKLRVLELVDISFSVERTLPQLQKRFRDLQLVFLFGSDAIQDLPAWPKAEAMLQASELVVGIRAPHEQRQVYQGVTVWKVQPQAFVCIDSHAADVSSARVRDALRRRKPVRGLLPSVARYSDQHWLYVSLA